MADAKLTNLYKLEKGAKGFDPNADESTKWEAVLKSANEKIVANAMYIAQQLLQQDQGFGIFKKFLISDDPRLCQTTMHLLVNYADHPEVRNIIQENPHSLERMLGSYGKVDNDKRRVAVLHFFSNLMVLQEQSSSSEGGKMEPLFIKSNGFKILMGSLVTFNPKEHITKEKESVINDVLNIISHLLSFIQSSKNETNLVTYFENEESFAGFSSVLTYYTKLTNSKEPTESDESNQNISKYVKMILSIMANVLNSATGRQLFETVLQSTSSTCLESSSTLLSVLDKYDATKDTNFLKLNEITELKTLIVTALANALLSHQSASLLLHSEGSLGLKALIQAALQSYRNNNNNTSLQYQSSALAAFVNLTTHEDILEEMDTKGLLHHKDNDNVDDIIIRALLSLSKKNDIDGANEQTTDILILIKTRAMHCLSNIVISEHVQESIIESMTSDETSWNIFTELIELFSYFDTNKNKKLRESEELKKYCLTAIFHLTIKSDITRSFLISESGDDGDRDSEDSEEEVEDSPLISLTQLLSSKTTTNIYKLEILKSLINLSSSDDEAFLSNHRGNTIIPVLLGILSQPNKGNTQEDDLLKEMKEFSSLILENLATNPALIKAIERSGGYNASLEFLKSAQSDEQKERSAALIARLSFNPNIRRSYQKNNEISNFLNTMASESDSNDSKDKSNTTQRIKRAAAIALGTISVPHFSVEQPSETTKQELDFSEFNADDFNEEHENDDEVFRYNMKYEDEETQNNKAKRFERKSKIMRINLDPITQVTEPRRSRFVSKIPESTGSEEPLPTPKGKRTIKRSKPRGGKPKKKTEDKKDLERSQTSVVEEEEVEIQNFSLSPDSFVIQEEDDPSTKKKDATSYLPQLGSFKSTSMKKDSEMKANTQELSLVRSTLVQVKTTGGSQSTDPERLAQAKMYFRRTKVAQELLTTEATYVRNLSIIIKKFQNPLLQIAKTSKKPLLQLNQIQSIFLRVDALFNFNYLLLSGLNTKMAQWSSLQLIGDLFLTIGDFYKEYMEYIENYDQSQAVLANAVVNNVKLAKWLERIRYSPICTGNSLSSYLIMPIQRLPRYELLLKELMKVTPPNHPDYKSLGVAIEKMVNVNSLINNQKKQKDHVFSKVLSFLDKLVGDDGSEIIQPDRSYLIDVPILWRKVPVNSINNPPQPATNHSKSNKGLFVIFNDSFVYTKSVSKKDKQKIVDILLLSENIQFKLLSQGERLITNSNFNDFDLEFTFKDKSDYDNIKSILDNLKKK
eukprot:TRINITY_DN7544_c0_g1_i1.p1 TRINITY_DN7544_c0_g1~~TRINITY_DN7544_c0_g1_i1.p1  ORF type:complete len:1260 (+),score=306.53 TRINITY_DN7544_c0_g1_i1:575-4354(+)